MGWYLLAYCRAQRGRILLTIAGLSLALASVFIAYGVAGWVDAISSKALSYSIDAASIWVVPPAGLRFDRNLGVILSGGRIPSSTVDAIRIADPQAVIRRVAVGVVQLNDRPVVLYATDEVTDGSLMSSPEIWRSLAPHFRVVVAGRPTMLIGPDPNLPSSAIRGAFDVWASALHDGSEPSWVLVSTDRPKILAERLTRTISARVTDSPDDLTLMSTNGGTTVFLLNASLSRFDPFSFRTKFSSLILDATMSSVFGWVARLVFILGLIFAITSALIGLNEKRHEIGLFAGLGLQTGITLILLAESAAVSVAAFVLGFVLAASVLAGVVSREMWVSVLGPLLVMGSFYWILLLVLTPLIAAQRVASRRASELVREGIT